jgi:hypothetical protein
LFAPFAFPAQKKSLRAKRRESNMTKQLKIGAALLALAILPAAVFLFHVSPLTAVELAMLIGPFAIGVVTVTYDSFEDGTRPGGGYAGGIVAPTAAQSANVNAIRAAVSMADTDTTATITHNWGLSAAQLAAGYPDLSFYVNSFGTANLPVMAVISFSLSANAVTITKLSATSSGAVLNCRVLRPWSGSN